MAERIQAEFPLSDGIIATVDLPLPFTSEDAERLCELVLAAVVVEQS